MAQQTAPATPALRSSFRYTPGNGYVYEWTTGQHGIAVSQINSTDPWSVDLVDVIPFPSTPSTATALMDAVDGWIGAGL